jgi:predicted transglutaminase-like cysteine proteinase
VSISPPAAIITPAMREAEKFMRAKFQYESDGPLDDWDIGVTIGDCEDYGLTILYLIYGRSRKRAIAALMRGEARMIYTKTPRGAGHAVLYYSGHYIDNRYPSWSTEWRYEIRKPYSRLMIGLKLATGRILA